MEGKDTEYMITVRTGVEKWAGCDNNIKFVKPQCDAIASLGGVLIVLFLIPMTFASAVSIYSLVIVAKYYQEIENENQIVPPTITIQQCTPRASTPEVVLNSSKEIATIYDPTTNPSAPPMQEPPPYN